MCLKDFYLLIWNYFDVYMLSLDPRSPGSSPTLPVYYDFFMIYSHMSLHVVICGNEIKDNKIINIQIYTIVNFKL